MKILVSACLLGENCKYNGGNNFSEKVVQFVQGREVIPVCPEVRSGLGTPRVPIEIQKGRVVTRDGRCVDEKIRSTVEEMLNELPLQEVECAILKSRSPTCGVHQVYDGTFTGTLADGMGVFAQALQDAGVALLDVEDL